MAREKKVWINGIEFTFQELLIIKGLKRGLSYQEIAEDLSISVKTVEYYIRNIKGKTNTDSKKELLDFFEKNSDEEFFPEFVKNKFSFLDNKKLVFYSLFLLLIFGITFFYSNRSSDNDKRVTNVLNFSDNLLSRSYLEGKIIRKLKQQDGIAIVVIYGEGGAGKTTIARKVLSDLNGDLKFEINAETEDTLYNSFIELAYYLAATKDQKNELDIIRNLKDSVLQKKRLVRFVSEFLRRMKKWSLLIDNVNSFESIKDYFPINESLWGSGNVLITTRNQNLGESNFIKRDCLINIGKLEENEKRELFSNIVYGCKFESLSEKDKKQVKEFIKSIPEFPLDVCAVAYYLKNTKVTFEEYEKLMKESVQDLTQEQKRLMKENASYEKTRYGIVSAIFKEISQSKKEFRILLLGLNLMDSQDIPKNILKETTGIINANNFINKLKEHSLITDNGREISMHRSNHEIGYNYIVKNLRADELEEGIHMLAEIIYKKGKRETKLIPHLESILLKISRIDIQGIAEDKAKLLLMLADILRNRSDRTSESLKYLEHIIIMNNKLWCLSENFLAQVKLRIGEIYTATNKNRQADIYLRDSLKYLPNESMEKVKCFRLLGIVRMRQYQFEEANNSFISALNLLKSVRGSEVRRKLSESNIYEDMSFNYFMDGINRENAKKAVPLMEKAIEVLEDPRFADIEEIISRKAVHKIKLAGIHNALAHYQKALEIAQETEELINKSGFDNADIFYVKGIIARERGLSYLRLNKVTKAYDYFETAQRIFEKLMKGDYLFKLKTHEAECLVRMNRLDEAMRKCEEMFEEKERERNNYTDLFLNTSYYHAAVIKFKQKKYRASKRYFQKFVLAMRDFCKTMFSADVYQELNCQGVFDTTKSIEEFFENSLKIFEAVYWKDYEFTKYYVEKNL